MGAERQKGTVAKWLNHKGIGFITPEGKEPNEADILVHFSQIKQETEDNFKSLEQGSAVEYELEADPKDDAKFFAVRVTGPDGENCTPKTRRPKGEGKGPRKGKGKGKGAKGKGKGKGKREDAEEEADE